MGLSWSSLVKALHPPLPMSPRECARLLALLKMSFNQQLNRQHLAGSADNERQTDLHLHSIVTNPLFVIKRRERGQHDNRKAFGEIQELLKHPMDIFKEQVATGSATLETATDCLKAHYNNCLASPEADAAIAMRTSGAGATVLEWLWSSGVEESGKFLNHQEFISLMVKFLVTESRHDRIRQWLWRWQPITKELHPPQEFRNFHYLLSHFVRSEISVGKGLESATAMFTHIAQEIQRRNIAYPIKAFYGITNGLTIKLIYRPKGVEPQHHVLEPFMRVAKTFGHKPDPYLAALHDVYLVGKPNPCSALTYLHAQSAEGISRMVPSRRRQTVLLGLETTEICLNEGRQAEAMSVMEILRDHFSDEIGLRLEQPHKDLDRESDRAEERSLRMLDALAIA